MKISHILVTILFLVIATWVVTMSERSVRGIQAGYYNAVQPFVQSGSKLEDSVRLFLDEVQSSRQLETRLKAVEAEFGRLQATEARYKQIESENQRLRKALEFKQRTKFDLVSCRVLRRLPSSWWETITIEKGQNERIATQFPVLSEKGLIGKIDRVSDYMSTVLLITDESCLISAKVEGTPEQGIVSGQRGEYGEETMLKLKYLTNDISVKPGTRVLTSGKGGVFPDGLEVGTIVSIEKGPLYAEALVKPSFNLQETDMVFTLIKPES